MSCVHAPDCSCDILLCIDWKEKRKSFSVRKENCSFEDQEYQDFFFLVTFDLLLRNRRWSMAIIVKYCIFLSCEKGTSTPFWRMWHYMFFVLCCNYVRSHPPCCHHCCLLRLKKYIFVLCLLCKVTGGTNTRWFLKLWMVPVSFRDFLFSQAHKMKWSSQPWFLSCFSGKKPRDMNAYISLAKTGIATDFLSHKIKSIVEDRMCLHSNKMILSSGQTAEYEENDIQLTFSATFPILMFNLLEFYVSSWCAYRREPFRRVNSGGHTNVLITFSFLSRFSCEIAYWLCLLHLRHNIIHFFKVIPLLPLSWDNGGSSGEVKMELTDRHCSLDFSPFR